MALGSRRFTTSNLLKFAVASGGAEAISTAIGYWAGAHVISLISDYDHWIAFGLLAAVAVHMAFEGVQGLRGKVDQHTVTQGHSLLKLLVVSFATSMDAFGVGIGLGLTPPPGVALPGFDRVVGVRVVDHRGVHRQPHVEKNGPGVFAAGGGGAGLPVDPDAEHLAFIEV